MGTLQSSIGLITGTDIAGTVDQLIAISARPRDRLQSRTQLLQSEQTAVADLTATVIGVQLAGTSLSNTSTFRARAATSSNSESLSVSAGSASVPGNYSVRTLQNASTQNVLSRARFDSDSEALGFTGTLSINPDGFLDQSTSLSDLNNGRGVDGGTIRITDRSGQASDIDLSSAETIDDVLQAINDAQIDVQATTTDGRIQLIDQTGLTTSNLRVEQLGLDETAADLGLFGVDVASDTATGNDLTFEVDASTELSQLRQARGVRFAEGTDLTITVSDGTTLDVDFGDFGGNSQPTIQDVVDQINLVDPARVSASFTDGGIEITDLSGGSESFSIADATDSNAATDLGLVGSTDGATLSGTFETQTLRGTALTDLAGGAGISGLTTLDVTTSDGTATAIDLSNATNTAEILDAINRSGAGVTARLNDAGNGLRLRDVSGGTGNFTISSSDNTAEQLGLIADTQSDIVNGSSLGRQTVDRSTLLSSLNLGAGVTSGSFTIQDSSGGVGAVNLAVGDLETVGDLIDTINDLNIDVTASLNENGDGIVLVDEAGGTETFTVEDTGNGTAARDLGIAGEGTEQTVGGQTVVALLGSESDRFEITAEDSLSSIVTRINETERFGTASVETNSDGTVSLRIRSNIGGAAGRLGISTEGFDLNLDTTAAAQDARIAVSVDGGDEQVFTSTDGVFDLSGVGADSNTISSATSLSDFASAATSGSFTIRDSAGVTSAINVTVQGIETVGGLVDAINSLGIGVQASINEEATGINIVDTAGGDEPLTIADVGNGIAAQSLGIVGEATEQTINGETVDALVGSGFNAEENGVSGLSFTLLQLSDEPITVNVSEDTSAVTNAVTTFVNQYNVLIDQLDTLTAFNSETNEVGLLFGSSEANRIRSGYSQLLSGVINGAGNIRSLGQLGIRLDSEGDLNLDVARLNEAIAQNPEDVETFFTAEGTGLADRLDALADTIAGVGNGLLLNRGETLGTQIQQNNAQIDFLNEQLDRERTSLLEDFVRTEEAIGRLQSNSSAISQIQRITIPT